MMNGERESELKCLNSTEARRHEYIHSDQGHNE